MRGQIENGRNSRRSWRRKVNRIRERSDDSRVPSSSTPIHLKFTNNYGRLNVSSLPISAPTHLRAVVVHTGQLLMLSTLMLSTPSKTTPALAIQTGLNSILVSRLMEKKG